MELWGGLECTVNRVGDRYHDQFAKCGHLDRLEDLDRVAELGIRTLRYPVLWERTSPDAPDQQDWRFADERLGRLKSLGIAPIAGLVHHGSGPRYTDLLDDGFAPGLATHARAVAERFPWIDAYTPVNEPLTTARFSALYGHWYPHATDGRSFAKALVNQIRATVLGMEAIRKVNPEARLVQTDDLGKTHATQPLAYQADFDNERRWLGWDLLCGRVDRIHPMWDSLVGDGVDEMQLGWFLDHPCPPDVVGVNYYLTSERFLDHRLNRYPSDTHGANAQCAYADVEAVRVLAGGIDGPSTLLKEAGERYGLPLAITECHLGCTREEQMRWLRYVWTEAENVRREGVDVRAVTVWSLFGAHDWCSLLTCERNRYEPGVFDVRAPEPRPTALASVVSDLAVGRTPSETGEGWWERPIRLVYPPVLLAESPLPVAPKRKRKARSPLLVLEDGGGLGRTIAALCELRGLDRVVAVADETEALAWTLERVRPWAVVDARSPGSVPEAATLAEACAKAGVRIVVFSSDRVFDGHKASPYLESDPTDAFMAADGVALGAEASVRERFSDAMIVRTGTLFGAHDRCDRVQRVLRTLLSGRTFEAPGDVLVSPTSMTDLVHATLDLLIDGMGGIVHLTNKEAVSPAEFARRIADRAGLDPSLVVETREGPGSNTALASERAWVMPTLDDALARAMPSLLADVASRSASYLA